MTTKGQNLAPNQWILYIIRRKIHDMTLHVSYQNFVIAGTHTTFRYARTKYSPRSPRIWHLFSEILKSFFTRVQRKSGFSGIFSTSDVAHPTLSSPVLLPISVSWSDWCNAVIFNKINLTLQNLIVV